MKKIVIIDGQGGRMGKGILEQLRQKQVKAEIGAVGTNSIATATTYSNDLDYCRCSLFSCSSVFNIK